MDRLNQPAPLSVRFPTGGFDLDAEPNLARGS
jgi:hypothetical protein